MQKDFVLPTDLLVSLCQVEDILLINLLEKGKIELSTVLAALEGKKTSFVKTKPPLLTNNNNATRRKFYQGILHKFSRKSK